MESNGHEFTEDVYRSLVHLASKNYTSINYSEIDFSSNRILWRHDIDCSINRAYRIAEIDLVHKMKSTFFVHLQSSFYNSFEKSQVDLLRKISQMGFKIGLHFDANWHSILEEKQLTSSLSSDRSVLENLVQAEVSVFSFHNPQKHHLEFDADQYSGMMNCYSKNLMRNFEYVSDSNGYWRFQNLFEILEKGTSPRLQVLTHPEWWQEVLQLPRNRIVRSVLGRAIDTIKTYDAVLKESERLNVGSMTTKVEEIQHYDPEVYISLISMLASGHEKICLTILQNLILEELKTTQGGQVLRELFRSFSVRLGLQNIENGYSDELTYDYSELKETVKNFESEKLLLLQQEGGLIWDIDFQKKYVLVLVDAFVQICELSYL